jgi:hypothetical protein
LREKFNPRNINHMPAAKFFARLDLDQICLFLDGHSLAKSTGRTGNGSPELDGARLQALY